MEGVEAVQKKSNEKVIRGECWVEGEERLVKEETS